MAKNRVTRKQLLKEPDEFITFTGKMIQFARRYQQQILYGAGAVFLILLFLSGYRYYSGWKEQKAFAALNATLAQHPENPAADATAAGQGKAALLKIADQYSGYAAGRLARLIYANRCYTSGDFDAAVAQYLKAVKDFQDHPSLNSVIHSSIGYAYEAKKAYPEAVEHFQRVVSDPNGYLKDEALFNMGLIYAKMGNAEKSREAFRKLLDEYANSSYVELVKERMAG